jgi:hypothetical protein
MQPAEILHRVVEKARKSVSRRKRHGWQNYPVRSVEAVYADLPSQVAGATVGQRQAIASAATAILDGKFSALGQSWPHRPSGALFPEHLWSLDPVTGKFWPGNGTYTFDIAYRHDGSHGDIKYAWEIGRLQFLPVLAMHVVFSGEEQAVKAIDDAIDNWHRANPPFTGIGWASGIEVALRAISLITTHDLVGDRLETATRDRISQILSASLYWLKRFPSRYSSANNHLIAELAGEYLIDLSLGGDVDDTERQIATEVSKQIFADGCGAEQSPTYAAFSVELVLFCLAAGRAKGRHFPETVRERMQAFVSFAAWLPTGATYGDNDEGRVLTLGGESDYVASVAAAVAGFFGTSGVAVPADDFRAVFFGRPVLPVSKPSGLHVFDEGGLSIWRGKLAGSEAQLLFDHGPLGYLSIAAHGHADALSLTLWLDDQPVLVDPGTYAYGAGGAWRDRFRSTMAHNTLNIDGESQSIMSGAFNWSHKARTAFLEHQSGEDWSLTAEHDGYERRFGAKHRRRLRHEQGNIVITDWLSGGVDRGEIVFQLASGLTAHVDAAAVRVSKDGALVMTLLFPTGDIRVTSGGDLAREGGWVSPGFGKRVAAPRIVWRGRIEETGVDTMIVPAARSGLAA